MTIKKYKLERPIYAKPMTYGEFRMWQELRNIYNSDGTCIHDLTEEGYAHSYEKDVPQGESSWMAKAKFEKQYTLTGG